MASPSPVPSTSRRPLTGAEDLLTFFRVVDIYDRYARPFLKVPPSNPSISKINGDHEGSNGAPQAQAALSGLGQKGKNPATEVDQVNGQAGQQPTSAREELKKGGGGDGGSGYFDDYGALNDAGSSQQDSCKKVKMEKTYSHYVADIGGKNQIKRDKFLHTLIADPDEHRPNPSSLFIALDETELRQAFTLEAGSVVGFDPSNWVAEEGGPKRKRKRRRDAEVPADSTPVSPAQPKVSKLGGHTHDSTPNPSYAAAGATSIGTPNLARTSSGKLKEDDHRKKKKARI